eukprot:NODE_12109_length_391_cov_3.222222_g10966_i0.p4 GENE.NODE_12109_length_391_cov_3.222222_g10966_i0~~NODE_12109_length_391_cov_3.222222_g10966_i0.p4  ORF type:complete len:66 (+),score=4.66 NODE_12109_length_391_cov_3.222222_g10966_i0:90-287(+)
MRTKRTWPGLRPGRQPAKADWRRKSGLRPACRSSVLVGLCMSNGDFAGREKPAGAGKDAKHVVVK